MSSMWNDLGYNSQINARRGTFHPSLNDRELIFIAQADHYLPSEIYIFCTNNQWKKCAHSPDDIDLHIAVLDKKNKLLYINDVDGKLFIINIKNKTFKKIEDTEFHYEGSGTVMIINNVFHVFDIFNYRRLIWNDATNRFANKLCTPKTTVLSAHMIMSPLRIKPDAMAYISSTERVLIIGRQMNHIFSINCMYWYSIKDNKWSKLSTQLPRSLMSYSYVLTHDEQYLIILGGMDNFGHELCDIYFLQIKTMRFTKSRITCPTNLQCKAIIPSHKISDELSVFGYVRQIWKGKEFNHLMYPPMYLIQLVCGYYRKEILHLIETINSHRHWQIDIDHILTCTDI